MAIYTRMMRKNLLLAVLCKLLITEQFPIQETPQKVVEVRTYEACVDAYDVFVQKKVFYKIDSQKTKESDEVLWRLPRITTEQPGPTCDQCPRKDD